MGYPKVPPRLIAVLLLTLFNTQVICLPPKEILPSQDLNTPTSSRSTRRTSSSTAQQRTTQPTIEPQSSSSTAASSSRTQSTPQRSSTYDSNYPPLAPATLRVEKRARSPADSDSTGSGPAQNAPRVGMTPDERRDVRQATIDRLFALPQTTTYAQALTDVQKRRIALKLPHAQRAYATSNNKGPVEQWTAADYAEHEAHYMENVSAEAKRSAARRGEPVSDGGSDSDAPATKKLSKGVREHMEELRQSPLVRNNPALRNHLANERNAEKFSNTMRTALLRERKGLPDRTLGTWKGPERDEWERNYLQTKADVLQEQRASAAPVNPASNVGSRQHLPLVPVDPPVSKPQKKHVSVVTRHVDAMRQNPVVMNDPVLREHLSNQKNAEALYNQMKQKIYRTQLGTGSITSWTGHERDVWEDNFLQEKSAALTRDRANMPPPNLLGGRTQPAQSQREYTPFQQQMKDLGFETPRPSEEMRQNPLFRAETPSEAGRGEREYTPGQQQMKDLGFDTPLPSAEYHDNFLAVPQTPHAPTFDNRSYTPGQQQIRNLGFNTPQPSAYYRENPIFHSTPTPQPQSQREYTPNQEFFRNLGFETPRPSAEMRANPLIPGSPQSIPASPQLPPNSYIDPRTGRLMHYPGTASSSVPQQPASNSYVDPRTGQTVYAASTGWQASLTTRQTTPGAFTALAEDPMEGVQGQDRYHYSLFSRGSGTQGQVPPNRSMAGQSTMNGYYDAEGRFWHYGSGQGEEQ